MNKRPIHLSDSEAQREAGRVLMECPLDGSYTVEFKRLPNTRTARQNRALHKYLDLLAAGLSEGGYTVQVVLAKAVDREWDMEAAKSLLWKPIQKAMLGKESTADADTTDYTKVYETLNRFMGEKFGMESIPWPTKDHQ